MESEKAMIRGSNTDDFSDTLNIMKFQLIHLFSDKNKKIIEKLSKREIKDLDDLFEIVQNVSMKWEVIKLKKQKCVRWNLITINGDESTVYFIYVNSKGKLAVMGPVTKIDKDKKIIYMQNKKIISCKKCCTEQCPGLKIEKEKVLKELPSILSATSVHFLDVSDFAETTNGKTFSYKGES